MRSLLRTETDTPHPKGEDFIVIAPDRSSATMLGSGTRTPETRPKRPRRLGDVDGVRPGSSGTVCGLVGGILFSGGVMLDFHSPAGTFPFLVIITDNAVGTQA